MRPILPWLVATVLLVSVPAPAQDGAPRRGAAAAPALPAQPDALPTVEGIQKLLKSGDAQEALKQVNRLMSLRGKAAEGYDKYELLTLKGDVHLKLKANEAALASFRQAAAATEDPQQQAVARATELLIKRSKNLAYTPKKAGKGEKAEPIDLVEPASRQKALAALFVDEVAPLLPKVEAAKAANSVVPMIKAMAAAREVQFLERAANGSADQTSAIVDALGEQGEAMLSKVLGKATKRVDRITTLANEIEHVRTTIPAGNGGYRTAIIPKQRGIRNDDVVELKNIIDGLDEVMAQANALGQARGTDDESVEDLVESSEDLKLHVQRMLRVHDIEYAGRREGRDS
jgi:hypothetical protein